MCEEYEKNNTCTNENCSFAHGIHDLRHTDDFYKTSLCFNFTKGKFHYIKKSFFSYICIIKTEGKCENGDKCRYAHGDSELKKKLIKFPF